MNELKKAGEVLFSAVGLLMSELVLQIISDCINTDYCSRVGFFKVLDAARSLLFQTALCSRTDLQGGREDNSAVVEFSSQLCPALPTIPTTVYPKAVTGH